MKTQNEIQQHIQLIEHYTQALAILGYDAKTGAPHNSKGQTAKIIGTLSKKLYELQTDSSFGKSIEHLLDKELNEFEKKQYEVQYKTYKRLTSIPSEVYNQLSYLKAKTSAQWGIAKRDNNFNLVKDDLIELININKKVGSLVDDHMSPYDQLLDQFEPNIHTNTIDRLFGNVKNEILPFLHQLKGRNTEHDFSFLKKPFPLEKQRKLATELLKAIDYNFDAGQLRDTLHPFSAGVHPDDARVAIKYVENDVKVAALMTLHEGGHCIYTQNVNKDLVDTGLGRYTSMGLHESQSIFWEKIIGKHKGFWKNHYYLLQNLEPEIYQNISAEQFHLGLHEVKPSLIRYEADDITYPLHIIIRYEIEKALFTDQINVSDLPEIWNDKYESYLGIRPTSDTEGILQDIHWYSGSFGYFPSYLLGFIYAAQLRDAIIHDLPNFDQLIEENRLVTIRKWLTEHIHQYGKLKTSNEILNSLNISGINEQPLLKHLKEKYREIYKLQEVI